MPTPTNEAKHRAAHEHKASATPYCPDNLWGDLGLGHAVHALCIDRFTALVGMADNGDGDRFPQ